MANLKELLGNKANAVMANSYIAIRNNKSNGETFRSKKVIKFMRKKNATEKFANTIMNYCLTHKPYTLKLKEEI